ncbi:reverse transcriptase [Senna tora]|uniref:Reverse transcriptase n=1 Tax=Senna tora TaxID=362788 RepID=A0A835C870_9FABA|nr:reverse transcriptase [Senna tora]
MVMKQENPKDLSTKEQDNLRRSTKKSKPNEKDDGITLVLPSVKELEAMTEMTDAENPAIIVKEGHSKVVRSLNWGNNNGGAITFKDKLLAFNGREYKSSPDPVNGETNQTEKPVVGMGQKRVEVGEDHFGPWMIPQRRPRRVFRRPQQVRADTDSGNTPMNQSSRFEVLNQVLEEDNRRDSGKDQQMTSQPDNHDPIDILKTSGDTPSRVDSKKVVKNANRKIETATGAKKSNTTVEVAPGNKKTGKAPFEKATEHTVVTSSSSGIKNSSQSPISPSPGKNKETTTKINSKPHIEGGAPKQKKPPDYNEVNFCKGWKKLCKCECPERVRYFLWKLSHDCIMTEVQRKKRGISIYDVCKRCGLAAEATTHAIRDCVWVRGIWEKLVKRDMWNTFFNLDIKSWVDNNISKNWGGGFTKKLGQGSVFQAELWGALLGLKTVFITNGCNNSNPFLNMAKEFRELLSKDWMVNVKHVHRDSNKVADILANSAHFNSYELMILDRVPYLCKVTFLDDHNRVLAAHRLGS